MKDKTNSLLSRALSILSAFFFVAVFGICIALLPAWKASAARRVPSPSAAALRSEPWTDAQTVKPADLVKEIANTKGANKPVVVCAGFRVLYEGAHIPGAVFRGPATSPQGVDDLKKWAQGVSRSSNVVVYCGCCPFTQCPNIRPAFEALRSMGFTHLRVLLIPEDFATNWLGNGYPVEKGK